MQCEAEGVGARVHVYRNLIRSSWSILGREGLVEDRLKRVHLKDVVLKVRKGGWKRAKQSGARNVHAFAVGDVVPWERRPGKSVRLKYDIKEGCFRDQEGRVYHQVREAWLNTRGFLWAKL